MLNVILIHQTQAYPKQFSSEKELLNACFLVFSLFIVDYVLFAMYVMLQMSINVLDKVIRHASWNIKMLSKQARLSFIFSKSLAGRCNTKRCTRLKHQFWQQDATCEILVLTAHGLVSCMYLSVLAQHWKSEFILYLNVFFSILEHSLSFLLIWWRSIEPFCGADCQKLGAVVSFLGKLMSAYGLRHSIWLTTVRNRMLD